MKKIFAKIRFYWGALVIATIVGGGMIPLIYLFPKYKGTIMHKLNRVILMLLGARIEKEGGRDPNANLFILNHQGIIDIITMEAIENTHFSWVAKKELFKMPWFGHLLRLGDMISVDRENKAGLIKLLKDAQNSLEKGRAVAIFPEGTRAKDQKLLPFKSGTKLLASKLKMRVQPVVITGSKRLLNEHNQTAHNSTIKVTYLPAFDIADAPKDWYKKIQSDMQTVIDKEYEKFGRTR